MRTEDSHIFFSATDLATFLGCRHATELNRAIVEGRAEKIYRPDPMLDLLKELGDRHEQSYLDHLRSEGKIVAELPKFEDPLGERTKAAIQSGAAVIAQASLIDLPWRGFADFLIKVNRPSDLGDWSYEVVDTKLSHTTKATAVLQLCLYSEIVTKIQGVQPEWMHVVKPGDPFEIDSLRLDDYMAYFRMVKRRFEESMAGEPDTTSKPEPCSHCGICDWWPRCNQQWRDADHLSFVAGLSTSQQTELKEQGTTTLEQFAMAETPLPKSPKRGSLDAFAKAQRQAKIQLKGRQTGKPEIEFNEVEADRGFLKLPPPNEGDIFFDIEGNPRAIGEGLEYLFGYVMVDGGSTNYHERWALSATAERELFHEFITFLMDRWHKYPDMHIYHYAPYEPSAMKRLATKHAMCEVELDSLLRGRKFVDLYSVTRQAIRASVESYSIKQLEPFYRYERLEMLEEASKALREVERLIELGMTTDLTEEHRRVVATYNKDDCLSTLELRQWLEQLRSRLTETGCELPRPPVPDHEAKDSIKEMSAEAQRVYRLLTFDIDNEPQGDSQKARWLLAHMLEYFRREAKCAWWNVFYMTGLEHEELLQENSAISGLEFAGDAPNQEFARVQVHRYRFPAQETILEPGDQLWDLDENAVGSVVEINLRDCTIDIKKRDDTADVHPSAVFEFLHVRPGSMPESLCRFGEQVAAAAKNNVEPRSARFDLLTSRPPRLQTLSLPRDGDFKDAAIELARDLDYSYLAIQGPPGSGKTYVGSHMIFALAKSGKHVGVSAVGHRVIDNLLEAVHQRATEADDFIRLAHQISDKEYELPSFVRRLSSKGASLEALYGSHVVGGTAWLWSDEFMEQQLDYLFIDEAGQMSLAMALAAGRAAKNVVLLGDPQQLEQPQQAVHPHGSGIAALSHVLAGADTISDDKGLFLSETWRLHPSICNFTSEQYYEGRLSSVSNLHLQEVLGDSPFVGSGLRIQYVEHEGNQNRSFEEVEAVVGIVNQLSGGSHQWTRAANGDSEILPLTLQDILIVAPYNAQVSALRSALPDDARVGTVDKFQGQEAPVVIYSMTSSSANDAPRGMSFLYNRNRMNVATSRARCLAILVCSPKVLSPECVSPDQIRLANGLCRFNELS